MKKLGKGLLYLIVIALLIVVVAISYVTLALPNVGEPENIKVEATPQRIERGKYLALHVAVCPDCHSPHDATKFGLPADSTHLGAGGMTFDKAVGFPGHVVVPNITPFKLKEWSDGEIFRAITTGVKKDGSAIFPLMPWPYYSKMDREDIYSIIAYLRTLKPFETNHPKASLDFPLNILVHTMPAKATLGTKPPASDTLKYGEYLVQSASCKDCHSQDNQGKLLPGLEFAGGKAFGVGTGTVRTANITPDENTGIGKWTKHDFIARFRTFSDESKASHVGPTDFQTIMPWWNYGKLTDADLSSIYAYLRTVKPVSNKVVKFTANSAAVAGSN